MAAAITADKRQDGEALLAGLRIWADQHIRNREEAQAQARERSLGKKNYLAIRWLEGLTGIIFKPDKITEDDSGALYWSWANGLQLRVVFYGFDDIAPSGLSVLMLCPGCGGLVWSKPMDNTSLAESVLDESLTVVDEACKTGHDEFCQYLIEPEPGYIFSYKTPAQELVEAIERLVDEAVDRARNG